MLHFDICPGALPCVDKAMCSHHILQITTVDSPSDAKYNFQQNSAVCKSQKSLRLILLSGDPSASSPSCSKQKLLDALQKLITDRYHKILSNPTMDELEARAQWIDASCAALSQRAGGVRPSEILPPAEAEILADMERHVLLPEMQWPHPLPRSCHKVHPKQRRRLYRRLLDNGLARLVPAELIPKDPNSGRWLAGGCFGVSKKGKRELRLIFDRRPQNATNRRLRWATLPQPSHCLLYTSPSPRDKRQSRMPSSA